ncbi:TIGR02450 family Trp-rich protein [Undibacterium sp. TJN19]|uniref:TIGR02450 family Trp-rich protein n=1 Tax=Undibacterium sp. TJN19 TaxID=3413055 RepID=UPI003BF3606D
MNSLHPKKLLLSKWTAVEVVARQKHFLVSEVIQPEDASETEKSKANVAIEFVELEAVYSKEKRRIAWKELTDSSKWRQGWV